MGFVKIDWIKKKQTSHFNIIFCSIQIKKKAWLKTKKNECTLYIIRVIKEAKGSHMNAYKACLLINI